MKNLPNRPLNELDIIKYAQHLPNFRGIFMRNKLPRKCLKTECGALNLDDSDGFGTHWCAYLKKNNKVFYYDSFGNLCPPQEFVDYVGKNSVIFYNYKQYQKFDTYTCGHLCLKFLYEIANKNTI